MLGKEGVISMWTMGINLLGYHCIGDYYRTTTQISYVDMKTLYPSSLVAIISTERNVTFWDVGSKGKAQRTCLKCDVKQLFAYMFFPTEQSF